jgi:hypothetical protein
MKIFLLVLIALLINVFSYSQEIPNLKLTPNGVEPIVVITDSLKAVDLYKNALNWVKNYYKNPDKVLMAKFENEKIRIDGYAINAWWYKTLGMKLAYNMDYTVEVSFKDGKYKFEYIIGQFYVDGGQKFLSDYKAFYKNSGEIKNVYKEAVPSLELTMNTLSDSFYKYVTGKTNKKDDKW